MSSPPPPPPGRPSVPILPNKKSPPPTSSSTSVSNINTKRATSTEGIAYAVVPALKKESSSGFNYQSLTETSPLNVPKIKSKPPVRSHSSTNAELSYHLQQLRNIGKRKTTISGDDRNNTDERIRLTSSNLKVECDEDGDGTSIHTTMEVETIEASIELPISWKPAIQQNIPQRDAWDHKVEFLLAVIGYAVDLGTFSLELLETVWVMFKRFLFRQRLAVSNSCLCKWWRSFFYTLFYSSHFWWITTLLVY
jgi:hypothetical protein